MKIVVGGRRIGRTRFLREAAEKARAEGVSVIYAFPSPSCADCGGSGRVPVYMRTGHGTMNEAWTRRGTDICLGCGGTGAKP